MIFKNVDTWLRQSKPIGPFTLSLFLAASHAQAVDITDDFDGSELDTTVWEGEGAKVRTVDAGSLTFATEADDDDWESGNISSQQRLLLPPTGETTTIIWTLGAASITSPNPNNDSVVRYQIGIHSANETTPDKQHWTNTTGGLWIDLDTLASTDTTTASGSALYAADNKLTKSNATNLGDITLDWDWTTDTHVLKLTLTNQEYSWFDGDTLLHTDTFANAGIDTEFSNGFRVLAAGMNYEGGRGTVSYDKIEILNGTEPSGPIANFESDRPLAFSGQEINLSWLTAVGTILTLDPEVGNVDALTTSGSGLYRFIAPEVTEPTIFEYILTGTLAEETVIRTASVEVIPNLPLSTDSFIEEFNAALLNDELWNANGEKSYLIQNGKIEWNNGAGDWGHGEIETKMIYPIPEGDNTTTITWTYGPSTVTTENDDGSALRPLMGIFSGYEDEDYSKQHWQNDEGGIWLDLTQMGNTRPDGVSGNIHIANDTKTRNTSAEQFTNVDIPDWNWQTENHKFSLVLSATGFTWFNEDTELGTGLYSDYGIDTEFEAGFGIMAMAGNANAGRGEMALESISLDNGALPFNPGIIITDIDYSPASDILSLEWVSRPNTSYAIYRLDINGVWQLSADELLADGTSKTATLEGITDNTGIFRIIEE